MEDQPSFTVESPAPGRCNSVAKNGTIGWAVKLLLKAFPLFLAIRMIGVFFPLGNSRVSGADRDWEVDIANEFGVAVDGQCLPRSLCRFAQCRRYGIADVELVLGVFTPTDEMHAWVEIAGKPLLECPDFLSHYQTCVRYHGC